MPYRIDYLQNVCFVFSLSVLFAEHSIPLNAFADPFEDISAGLTGVTASSVAWGYYMKYTAYGILFATALGDLLLYYWMGDVRQCYRCGAEYRGGDSALKEPFRLETHEKYRQQAARGTRD